MILGYGLYELSHRTAMATSFLNDLHALSLVGRT